MGCVAGSGSVTGSGVCAWEWGSVAGSGGVWLGVGESVDGIWGVCG